MNLRGAKPCCPGCPRLHPRPAITGGCRHPALVPPISLPCALKRAQRQHWLAGIDARVHRQGAAHSGGQAPQGARLQPPPLASAAAAALLDLWRLLEHRNRLGLRSLPRRCRAAGIGGLLLAAALPVPEVVPVRGLHDRGRRAQDLLSGEGAGGAGGGGAGGRASDGDGGRRSGRWSSAAARRRAGRRRGHGVRAAPAGRGPTAPDAGHCHWTSATAGERRRRVAHLLLGLACARAHDAPRIAAPAVHGAVNWDGQGERPTHVPAARDKIA